MKRIIYVLIGPPAIGKSTWIGKNTDPDNTFIINRDDIVEEVANSYGWTYDDLYVYPPNDSQLGYVDEKYGEVVPAPDFITWSKKVFKKVLDGNDRVLNLLKQNLEDAKNTKKNIVVDLTNMRVSDRLLSLDKIAKPDDVKIAVVFNFKGKESIIKSVVRKRAEAAHRMGKSKTIPFNVIDKMINGYEPPTNAENFDKIIYSNTIPQLKQYAGLKEQVRKLIRNVINETLHPLIGK